MYLQLGGGNHDIAMIASGANPQTVRVNSDNDIDHFRADFSGFTEAVDWRIENSISGQGGLRSDVSNPLITTMYFEQYTLIGGSAGDQLTADDHNDRIEGRGGNDTLNAGRGEDYVDGGEGDDSVYAGAGNDIVIGGDGSDVINSGSGSDIIHLTGISCHASGYVAFNVSSDTQVGTQARINLEGLLRIEAVTDGGADADIVQLSDEGNAFFLHDAYSGFHSSVALTEDYFGNQSAARFANIEEIRGMGGDDIIDLTSPDYSLAGVAMTIDGGEGNDVIWGSDANENISGGNGDDTIFGGIGMDVLTGGLGADAFEFTRTSTNTSVTDFDASEGDTLRFYNAGGAAFDASSATLTTTGIQISYTDIASGIDHSLSISLAQSASDFTATLAEIQNALEII
jgi:Ca2+-binding RTX toxin-like protein